MHLCHPTYDTQTKSGWPMKLSFNVKSLGKKRPYIKDLLIDIDVSANPKLEELLRLLVKHQVDMYNSRKQNKNLLAFFDENPLDEWAQSGSVKFNEHYNKQQAEYDKSIDTVLQAFEDGLIAFFVDEEQIVALSQTINLDETSSITIVKLTFLSGTFW
jgi:hypothetical protein